MTYLMHQKKQFKMTLNEDIVDRLTTASEKFSRGSPQLVVEELIEIFLPTWVEMNAAMIRATRYQSQTFSNIFNDVKNVLEKHENHAMLNRQHKGLTHGMPVKPHDKKKIPLVGSLDSGVTRRKKTK